MRVKQKRLVEVHDQARLLFRSTSAKGLASPKCSPVFYVRRSISSQGSNVEYQNHRALLEMMEESV